MFCHVTDWSGKTPGVDVGVALGAAGGAALRRAVGVALDESVSVAEDITIANTTAQLARRLSWRNRENLTLMFFISLGMR